MGKINLLHESVFNKIAAGEVVERPASVIKELVENSIDAGASSIDVSIERSGMRSICILDNGSGMDSDDAVLCFEPHSTSKIRTQEDIFKISTMGFRGEALPSIASVSRVRLKTRRPDSIEGTEVLISGGKLISQSPAGCAPGTEILISDLFFNVPARKKFLKGEVTEQKHIYETVIQLALANPAVSFAFKVDGKAVFNSKGDGDLKSRISLLLGKEVADNSLFIDKSDNGYFLHGYFSRPSFSRNTRRDQRFFVNGRPVRSIVLSSAIREAYGSLVMHGLYPAVTIFVKVPVDDVDINVHPSKQEVRFRNERIISTFIISSLKDGLRESISPAPSVSISRIPANSLMDSSRVNYVFAEKEQQEFRLEHLTERGNLSSSVEIPVKNEADPTGVSLPLENKSKSEINELGLPGCGFIKVIGTLDRTYIIAVSDIGLVLIDQHAAHERIIFERILNDFSRSKFRQDLLIPVTLELARMETDFIKKYKACFDKLGFGIDYFGDNTILIHSIPSALRCENISGLISDILDALINRIKPGSGMDEILIAREACSLAVKAHDALKPEEIDRLIRDLAKCSIPFNCPHGRPTVINVSIKELEKRFGRIN